MHKYQATRVTMGESSNLLTLLGSHLDLCLREQKAFQEKLSEYEKVADHRLRHQKLWAETAEIKQRYQLKLRETLEFNLRHRRLGRIRIARIPHYKELGLPLPVAFGYENVLVAPTRVKKSLNFLDPLNLSQLAPENLRDSRGRLYINLVAFAACHRRIRAQNQQSGWTWPNDTHLSGDEATPEYYRWRKIGSARSYPIPHPEGWSVTETAETYLWPALKETAEIDNPVYDYYNGENIGMLHLAPGWETYRRLEYPLYVHLASRTEAFIQLAQKIKEGHNLQLLCQDAPEVLMSANGRPTPPFDRILTGVVGENGVGSLEINSETLRMLKSLDLCRLSHAYSLAIALLGLAHEL